MQNLNHTPKNENSATVFDQIMIPEAEDYEVYELLDKRLDVRYYGWSCLAEENGEDNILD